MAAVLIVNLFLVIAVLAMLRRTAYVIGENQRIVVFRLGRYAATGGPGLRLIVPFIDRAVVVSFAESVPGWESLSAAELEVKVREIAIAALSQQG